jgi:hypothetical protein
MPTGAAGGRPTVVQESLLDARPAQAAPVQPPARPLSGSSRPAPPPAAAAIESAGEPAAELGEAWQRVVAEVMRRKPVLGAVLQHAEPLRVSEGVLALGLTASPFHAEMLVDRANRDLINQAVQQHVPGARRFELDAGGGLGASAGSGARSHPAVQAALSAFQGEVVAVRPRVPEEGEPQ